MDGDPDYFRLAQAMMPLMPPPDPNELAARLNYFGNLPDREANLGPKDRSLAVSSNFLGLMPYARAAELARERGEGSFLWNLVNTGTPQKENERRALQQYYNDAYESAPDSMKVLSAIGLPGGAVSAASKMLPMASAPLRSSMALGAGMAGLSGYAAPIEPDTGDFDARFPSALDSARYGALFGAAGSAGARLAASPIEAINSARNWVAENAPGPNQFNMFAGPKAKTADQAALTQAQEMHDAGAPREDIWNKTGWFQGGDGKWRFEIPDNEASLAGIKTANPKEWSAEKEFSGINHPKLESAYGKFPGDFLGLYGTVGDQNAIHPLYGVPQSEFSEGMYSPGGQGFKPSIEIVGKDANEALSMSLHEKQHWIQDMENLAQGGSDSDFNRKQLISERLSRALQGQNPFISKDQISFDLYKKLAGEVEARNVEKRMNMTPEERRSTPPWETQDVPFDQQIVKFGGIDPQLAINAYHGSPHDFDRFDMSKIGTGEGAQAFGHGLYFAGNEGVAKSYQSTTVPNDPGSRALEYFSGDKDKAISHLSSVRKVMLANADESKNTNPEASRALFEDAKKYDNYIENIKNDAYKGRLYSVNLDVEPHDLLDWDKSLRNQSEGIRSKIQQKLSEQGISPIESDYWTGEHLLDSLNTNFKDHSGNSASTWLKDLGIPGIRYLDQGSRSAGEGSHNYVMFSHEPVTITHKDGTPIQRVAEAMAGNPGVAESRSEPYTSPMPQDHPIDNVHDHLADAIRAAKENTYYDHFGLRVTEKPLEKGKIAPNSFVWERDKPTNEELPGASAIWIDENNPASIKRAADLMGIGDKNGEHYYGKHVSLLGAYKRSWGADNDEIIMHNAEVLGTWIKEHPGSAARLFPGPSDKPTPTK